MNKQYLSSKYLIKIFIVIAMALFVSFSLYAKARSLSDLADEIDASQILLVSANGNGASSGKAITGYLLNQTDTVKYINIYLSRPIYLKNSGAGQDMVVAQIHCGEENYISDGRRSFIKLEPKIKTAVSFLGFCVDFDKDNPQTWETFSIGTTPDNLNRVIANINTYSVSKSNANIIVASQLAIWLAQGVTIQNIAEKIKFTKDDELLARQFIK